MTSSMTTPMNAHRPLKTLLGPLLLSLGLAACSNLAPPAAGSAPPAAAKAAASTAPAPEAPVVARAVRQTLAAPPPLKFEDAIARAGVPLFEDTLAALGNGPRAIVIDPLIDANSGAQTIGTVRMGQQLEALLKQRYSGLRIKPLTRQTLAEQPLLLIGTLTPMIGEQPLDTPPDAFRIWLTVIDLRTGRVVTKQIDQATAASVNPEPLPYFRDSPSWHKDKTVTGYIDSCQVDTRIGDPAAPDYLSRLPAAAVLNEALIAYDDGKVLDANRLYKEAAGLAGSGDLRVLNGLYLTSWQLGQRDAAQDAFGKLVASGLEAGRLPMKLLFKPGSTTFNDVGDLPTQYRLWLLTLAREAGKTPACMRVVGHTSRSGSANINERLSLRRAEAVAQLLESRDTRLRTRLWVGGAGSREALTGLGTDDQRDALDRRVEFRVVDCIEDVQTGRRAQGRL